MEIYIIDAFTNQRFRGNPAATVLAEKLIEDSLMQTIAAEMNLSETAFAHKISDNYFGLRWFTPSQEVKLCGHATLAMAHYLKSINAIDLGSELKFQTLSGELPINFEDDLIVMDFPALYPVPCSARSLNLLKQIIPDQTYECIGQTDNITVVLEQELQVLAFVPDFAKIAELDQGRLIITAIADSDRPYDFVSRFFAPGVGINEDPVTGSAHCTLTPFWANRLGKNTLNAKQLSARSGELTVVNLGDRVQLKGYAVTTLRGHLNL
jgi:PhzF family phenazine biosynthesis protein